MAVGRPPKPTHLHLLEGTFRKDRHGDAAANAPELELLEKLPRPPHFLGVVGQREWKRIGQELLDKRILTTADLGTFAGYCASLERAIRAETALSDYVALGYGMTMASFGGEVARPEVAIAKAAWTEVRKFAQEFGISPSSRTRVRPAPKKDDGKKPDDPWDALLNGATGTDKT